MVTKILIFYKDSKMLGPFANLAAWAVFGAVVCIKSVRVYHQVKEIWDMLHEKPQEEEEVQEEELDPFLQYADMNVDEEEEPAIVWRCDGVVFGEHPHHPWNNLK